MKTKSKLRKWGNSQGIILSAEMMKNAGLSVGEEVSLDVKNGEITIAPIKKKSRLAYLLDNYDPSQPYPFERVELSPTDNEII